VKINSTAPLWFANAQHIYMVFSGEDDVDVVSMVEGVEVGLVWGFCREGARFPVGVVDVALVDNECGEVVVIGWRIWVNIGVGRDQGTIWNWVCRCRISCWADRRTVNTVWTFGVWYVEKDDDVVISCMNVLIGLYWCRILRLFLIRSGLVFLLLVFVSDIQIEFSFTLWWRTW